MMRRAVASASLLLRKNENIGAHPWDAYRIHLIDLDGELAFRGDLGGCGNADSYYKAKRRRTAMARRLFLPFLRCLHTRKEKISNIEDEISAWLGREQAKSKGVSARVAFETNCRIDP